MVVLTIPDTYYLIRGKISGTQFVKNLFISGSGLGGTALGSALGSLLGPAGMIAGGFIGGLGSTLASKIIADKLSKDDSEKMMELVKVAITQLANDYLIHTNTEFERAMEIIKDRKLLNEDLLRVMFTIGAEDDNDFERVKVAYGRLDVAFNIVARQRPSRHISDEQILDSLNSLTIE